MSPRRGSVSNKIKKSRINPRTLNKLLQDVYYSKNSPGAYSGTRTVYREAKKKNPRVTLTQVENFLRNQETYTLHKPVRRKFPRNKVIPLGLDTDWQADLADMYSLAKYNNGNKYLLTCVDVFSKFAWAVPLKNKKPETVSKAFTSILRKSKRKPWRLMTDKGKEFVGQPFQQLMKKYGINHFTANNPDIKAPNVERYNRTLKSRLWKYFSNKKTFRYLEILQPVVDAINHSVSRTTGYAPVDIDSKNENKVWEETYAPKRIILPSFHFKVGDRVRMSKEKKHFEKGYLPNYTKEIFVVTDRIPRLPPVYKLKDANNESIEGVFYASELSKAHST